ncbi:MAG TPA: GntR family transcriptional regulator [Terracidiphilus sp.]|nr:GntR family transcriptional regulator [Terracidiphilus sp.]
MRTSSTRKKPPAQRKPARPEHGSSVNLAFQQIRELIVLGQLSAGAWIRESGLSGRLKMSRTPVRGALYLLQREGYVIQERTSSKSRMMVAPLTIDDARELYPMIGAIEGLAGRRAAQLPKPERNAACARLRAINRLLADIARRRNAAGSTIFDLDREFHRTIVSVGGGPRLRRLHQAIEPQAERYWRLYANAIIDHLDQSVEEHEAIIAGLADAEADRLENALRANWENGCKRLAHVMGMFGDQRHW